MEEGSNAIKILTDKPTGNRSLGRLRRRWEDNIRLNVKEIGISTRKWVYSAQGNPCQCGIELLYPKIHGMN